MKIQKKTRMIFSCNIPSFLVNRGAAQSKMFGLSALFHRQLLLKEKKKKKLELLCTFILVFNSFNSFPIFYQRKKETITKKGHTRRRKQTTKQILQGLRLRKKKKPQVRRDSVNETH